VLKFLFGIIVIQLVTAITVMTALNWLLDPQFIAVVVLFSLIMAVLAAFWFVYIGRDLHKNELQKMQEQHAFERERILLNAEREKACITEERSKLQEQHARERERILLAAEREKADIALQSYRKQENEIRKAHAKANFKAGVICTVAAAAGGVLIFSQLITVGMMVLIASGSGLAGYMARARHERLSRDKQLPGDEIKLIEKQMTIPPLLEKRHEE
jgi:ABC-type multidrug transport system fused ATPase/permease subunit